MDWEEKVARETEVRVAAKAESERLARAEAKEQNRKATEAKKAAEAPLRSARKSLREAEQRVQEAESEVAGLEAALADPTLYDGSPERSEEAGRLTADLREAREALDQAMEAWMEAGNVLEALESSDPEEI